jgi:signal transduction histidine kinase
MTLRRRLLIVVLGLGVLLPSVVGTVITMESVHYARRGARERLRVSLDTLARAITDRVARERDLLTLRVSWWAAAGADSTDENFAAWFAQAGYATPQLVPDPIITSRFLYYSPEDDTACEIPPTVQGSAGEISVHPASGDAIPPYVREWLPRLGDADTLELSPLNVEGAGGPVLAVAVTVPASRRHGTALLIEDISIIPLLRGLLARPEFQDLQSTVVLRPSAGGPRWFTLFQTDLTGIGLEVHPAEQPNPAAAALMVSPLRPSRPPERGSTAGAWRYADAGESVCAAGIHAPTGWVLGASLSVSPTLASMRSSVRLMVVFVVFMSLALVVGLVGAARGLGRSVEEIARKTELMAQGDLSHPIDLHRADELGVIADDVNRMAHDLAITAEARAIARLRTRIVHDLKGVASQMNLLLYNLRDRYDDPEFRAEFISLMQEAVSRVDNLTRRLRQTPVDLPPAWSEVDVRSLLERLVKNRLTAAWPRLQVSFQLAGPMRVVTDPELLTEILTVLLTNGAEAMKGVGLLLVRGGPIPKARSHRRVLPTHFLEILDCGPGMTERFLRNELFRPFVTTKPGGLGVGMYHAYLAAQKLATRIAVTSTIGRGTQVRIEIGRPAQPGG